MTYTITDLARELEDAATHPETGEIPVTVLLRICEREGIMLADCFECGGRGFHLGDCVHLMCACGMPPRWCQCDPPEVVA